MLWLAGFLLSATGQELRIEIEPLWQNKALTLDQTLPNGKVNKLTLSRLDGLLSRLALQRTDGSWLESADWYAFLSVGKGRLSAVADGLPPQEFKAIRFRVGVEDEIDSGDPLVWPPAHPLHPDVCGLHWGWNSGYVFLAIEGHWENDRGAVDGFSYHLAGVEKPMTVELPVRFSGAQPTTLRIGWDLHLLLEGGDVVREATSTHSREGDPLAAVLKERARQSFRVRSVHTDLYQPAETTVPLADSPNPRGTPHRLDVSERLPKVALPADNPLTREGIELGRRLFHEPKLSRNNRLACAGCHDRTLAFTDGKRHSLGESGQRGRRNAMSLANLAWASEFFWDGRAGSLREQVLMPIQDTHEMNETLERVAEKLQADDEYPDRFRAAFGTATLTPEHIALALEQFLLTLVSQDSRFDRAARRLIQLTAQEQRGLQLFVTEHDPARGLRGADCFHCHGGNLFSNHQFMNNGLEEAFDDLGRLEITKAAADRGKFKVPSLRNVALTAPYMHDGRFATLEEVVEHYNSGVRRTPTLDPNLAKHPENGLELSAQDKAALVAFLKALTDEQFISANSVDSAHSAHSAAAATDPPTLTN